ncbi:MAG: folylpolyglutamate synthase/dihydrofolate synthase family protein [Planctomycetaceae bacterium]
MASHVASYEQAVEYLYGRINYERVRSDDLSARDFKLDRMALLLDLLGNPHMRIPAVHIAGTKGKGSTAAMIAAVLTAAGHRTGLFTSPHLFAFEERMTVDGTLPTHDEIVALVNRVAEAAERLDALPGETAPTYFELTTAMAWLHFELAGCAIVALEVGLGGRLDATNLCRPEVTIVTNVSRDHTVLLGGTVERIAREKAAIAKPGVPMLTAAAEPALRVVMEACAAVGAPLWRLGREIRLIESPADAEPPGEISAAKPNAAAGWEENRFAVETPARRRLDLTVPLAGIHQRQNAALAVAAIDLLIARGWNVPEAAIRDGLRRTRWPLRIERIAERPSVVVDAAHNWAAAGALVETLCDLDRGRRRILIFAATRDKDYPGLLRRLLPRFDAIILTQYQSNPRGVPVARLRRVLETISNRPAHATADPAGAWKLARRLAADDDMICATGSFFLAAEIREIALDAPRAGDGETKPAASPREAAGRSG